MKEILLTQGKVALVDDADYEWLMHWKWHVRKNRPRASGESIWYAARNEADHGAGRKTILMHKALTGFQTTDHWDGDGLNNQRCNLRSAGNVQNGRNRQKQAGCLSHYKGVILDRGRWRARITINGCDYNLGCFGSETDAASAYNEAAREHFGEFARLNPV